VVMTAFHIRARLRRLFELEPVLESAPVPTSPDLLTEDDAVPSLCLWVCTSGPVEDNRKLIIRCEMSALTWAEVRNLAAQRLGVEPGAVDIRSFSDGQVIDLRWVGDDYAHGGTPERRRLQEFTDGEWVDA